MSHLGGDKATMAVIIANAANRIVTRFSAAHFTRIPIASRVYNLLLIKLSTFSRGDHTPWPHFVRVTLFQSDQFFFLFLFFFFSIFLSNGQSVFCSVITKLFECLISVHFDHIYFIFCIHFSPFFARADFRHLGTPPLRQTT